MSPTLSESSKRTVVFPAGLRTGVVRFLRIVTGLSLLSLVGCEVGPSTSGARSDALERGVASESQFVGGAEVRGERAAVDANGAANPARSGNEGLGADERRPCPEIPDTPSRKAISDPADCDNNPCNPYCRSYSESLDGGVMSMPGSGGAVSGWSQAALDDMPPGLVNMGRVEPCFTGADCQFNSQCVGPATKACSHDKCQAGEALTASCDPCVDDVCALIPECCTDAWDAACVEAMQQTCDVSCDQIGGAQCVPWVPGETDTGCDGVDLSVAPACGDIIPVCNHGTEEAPAGIRIVYFPANSQQYPKPTPDQAHPQMRECVTSAPVPPGTCIEVSGCPNLVGIREIMVNPPDPNGATTPRHVEECSDRDNWSLRANGVTCSPAACEEEEVTTRYRGACRFKFPGEGGRSPSRTKLRLTRGATTEETVLDLVPDAQACGRRNWYFEDKDDGLDLTLCPETCAEFREDPDTTLTADLACAAGGYEIASHSETYTPDCGPDALIQWGFLTYDFSTPDDSKVEVRIRFTDSEEELLDAPWELVATASSVLDTEKCSPLSGAPCPLDLYELLGGAPNAHAQHIQLMNTALPSSDGASSPTINSWNVSYSCLPEF